MLEKDRTKDGQAPSKKGGRSALLHWRWIVRTPRPDSLQASGQTVHLTGLQARTLRDLGQGMRIVWVCSPDSPTFTSQNSNCSDRLLDGAQSATSDSLQGTCGQSGGQI